VSSNLKQAEQPTVCVNNWTCDTDGLVERFCQDIGNFTEMLLLDTCCRWRRRLPTYVTIQQSISALDYFCVHFPLP